MGAPMQFDAPVQYLPRPGIKLLITFGELLNNMKIFDLQVLLTLLISYFEHWYVCKKQSKQMSEY